MTEGPTLLPHARSDKRTKEVFALYLQRMNARMARGFARGMDGLDGGLSGEWMDALARCTATVTCPVTVHVWNRYFSFAFKPLFLPGFHGQPPQSTTRRLVLNPRSLAQDFR
ncbi:hypothetical protein FQ192_04545 [Pseudomonas sp. ANT_J12]|nr:hypothetical protein FQ192_04545 [Pseudomonas sp. ANT_J12]